MRRSHLAWLALAFLTLPFVWGATRVRVCNSLEGWFVEGDPAQLKYVELLNEFGNDEIVVVGLEEDAPPGFDAGLRALPHVRFVRRSGPRRFEILPALLRDDAARDNLLDGIRELVRTQGIAAHLAGTAVIYQAVNRASHRDLERMLIPAAAVCALVLLAGVRRLGAVVAALAAMGISAVWALGLFGLTGVPLNLVTTMVPTVVAVLGLANALHLVRPREDGAPVLRACLFSALTSAAAFLALTISDVTVLRELGCIRQSAFSARSSSPLSSPRRCNPPKASRRSDCASPASGTGCSATGGRSPSRSYYSPSPRCSAMSDCASIPT